MLDIFEESLENITTSEITKQSIMEGYQKLTILVDEMIDRGIVINTDGESLERKMSMKENTPQAATTNDGGYFKSVIYFIVYHFSYSQVQKAMFPKLLILKY